MSTQAEMIARLFGRANERPKPLPRQTVEHDSVDDMVFGNYADDSPRFKRMAVEDAPQIAPNVPDPDPIDFTQATPEEITEWQGKARAAERARQDAPPYDAWENLTRDIFYSYHHAREPEVAAESEVDPSVAFHAKIARKMMAEDEHAQSRNITRDSPSMAAVATLAATKALREALTDELVEQARQSEEFERQREQAQDAMANLDQLRQQARDAMQAGQQPSRQLVEAIKAQVQAKRQAQAQAAQTAAQGPVPFSQAAQDAVAAAVSAAKDAARAGANMPSFGQGFGEGEPRYDSPEQALSIADQWANNDLLRRVAELYGRMDPDMRFKRAKRVVGGQDEIVDLKFGDELRRVLPSELALLADDDYEDDFFMRFVNQELLVYDTVGEEHAGRGPIVLVGDESGSMSGERNVWLKAIALCLLNIARREKRDFAYVGFSSGSQMYSKVFPAKRELQAADIVEVASHFYGGGTTPVIGLTEAVRVMDDAVFKKADIIMVSDGEAAFGDEDKMLRDRMLSRGVRFCGIGIGGSFRYLESLTEDVISIHDFQLDSPSEATAHLATHIS